MNYGYTDWLLSLSATAINICLSVLFVVVFVSVVVSRKRKAAQEPKPPTEQADDDAHDTSFF